MEKLDTNGEHQAKPTLAPVPKSEQNDKQEQSMPRGTKRKSKMSNEEQDLATHVSLCHLRYQQLEARLNGMEARLVKVENSLSELKVSTQQSFTEIKLLLERSNTTKQTQLIATFGTIITAVLAFVGYLITHQ
jgi:hypothetical protein